jgi:hypothetical protein
LSYQPPTPPSSPTPPVAPANAGSSGKATASLICAVVGIAFVPLILPAIAVILGYQAKAEIDNSGRVIGGRGAALAGIIIGWVGVAIGVFLLLWLLS